MLLVIRKRHPGTFWVFIVGNQSHANRTDGTRHRRPGNLCSGRSTVDREHVVVFARRNRQHGIDVLYLIAQAFDERRAQRAVNQARRQNGFGRRAPFSTEEAARDAASCIHTLFDVHGQREKVQAFFRLRRCRRRRQNHRVFIQVSGDGTICLPSQLPSFKTDGAGTEITIVDCGFYAVDPDFFINKHLHSFIAAHKNSLLYSELIHSDDHRSRQCIYVLKRKPLPEFHSTVSGFTVSNSVAST